MEYSHDFYSKKAKAEGYSARSVYKLIEIQQRFKIIKDGYSVLDIGAAPGSWTQYILRNFPRCSVVAVDKAPIALPGMPAVPARDRNAASPHGGAEEAAMAASNRLRIIEGDAFDSRTIEIIKTAGVFDTILSDAAPATSGNRGVDTAKSVALVEHVLSLKKELLKPGGNLALKLFQGGDEQRLLTNMRADFLKVKAVKPKACRKNSFEIYFLGLHKR